jgi:hypothetical protein
MTGPLRQAFYFPVQAGALSMRAGLFRFGTDFGNGQADGAVFLRDELESHYLAEKARVLATSPERLSCSGTARDEAPHRAVLAWMHHQTAQAAPSPAVDIVSAYRSLSLRLTEDFVILTRTKGTEPRVSLVSVCFPSGWAPEAILGLDFSTVHRPVPAFGAISRKSRQLLEAMLTRGPYVRFVWTLSPDPSLDHHPKHPRHGWQDAREARLRVERQITVPFPRLDASLFVIRTFLYSLDELSAGQRACLAQALRSTRSEILAYKGLLEARDRILVDLESSSDVPLPDRDGAASEPSSSG